MFYFKNYFFTITCILSFYINSHAQHSSHKFLKNKVEIHLKNGEKEEALKLSLKAINYSKKNNNIFAEIEWNNQTGKILKSNHDFTNALKYYNIAKELSEQTNDSLTIARCIFNIGSLNNLEYASASYNAGDTEVKKEIRTLAINQFEYILFHFKETKGKEEIFAKIYANLTGLYSYTENNKKSDIAAHKAIEYFTKLKDTISIIGVQSNLGVSQIYRKEYEKAEKNFLLAIPFLKDTSNQRILKYKTQNFNNLSEIYKATKNYKRSIEYLEKSINLNNVLDKKKHNLEISKIEEHYSQEKAILIVEEKAEVMQLWFGIILLIVFSLIIFGIIILKNNKLKSRNLQLKIIKSNLEKNNEIEKITNENQQNIITSALDARVEERKYIAEVLHDSVSSLLSSANMHLQVVKLKSDKKIEELDKSRVIIKEASDKIRNLSHKLTPPVLLKFGLSTALIDLCEKYSNSKLSFNFKNDGSVNQRFEENFEIKIYNIIEELTNNIIKHSYATKTTITLSYNNKQIKLIVADNGIGFNIQNIEKKESIGLNLIKSRVKNLKGNIQINTSKEKGTKIIIEVPVIHI